MIGVFRFAVLEVNIKYIEVKILVRRIETMKKQSIIAYFKFENTKIY